MVPSIERFHCIQDSQLGPSGVLYREVPLYTGQPAGSQSCPLKRGSTVIAHEGRGWHARLTAHLVLPVVVLGQPDQLVAQTEEVADVFVPLVPQLAHLQQRASSTTVERSLQQCEHLGKKGEGERQSLS